MLISKHLVFLQGAPDFEIFVSPFVCSIFRHALSCFREHCWTHENDGLWVAILLFLLDYRGPFKIASFLRDFARFGSPPPLPPGTRVYLPSPSPPGQGYPVSRKHGPSLARGEGGRAHDFVPSCCSQVGIIFFKNGEYLI